MDGSATFSDDQKYRYELSRVWDYEKPTLYWVCLNPSIADAVKGDHTIKKIITFSQNNGYGRCTVLNLFAYIATHPKDLLMADSMGVDIVGPSNDYYIQKAAEEVRSFHSTRVGWCHRTGASVVFAWGSSIEAFSQEHELWNRAEVVAQMFYHEIAETVSYQSGKAFYLTLTNNGHPGHPLRLAYSTPLQEWWRESAPAN